MVISLKVNCQEFFLNIRHITTCLYCVMLHGNVDRTEIDEVILFLNSNNGYNISDCVELG